MAKVCSLVPDKAVYIEMTHTSATGTMLPGIAGVAPFRRTTAEQFYAAAHLAYARGAQGISLFNFPYYRETSAALGPNAEPPYQIIPKLANPDLLAKMPQDYMLFSGWSYYISRHISLPSRISRMIPAKLSMTQQCIVGLDMDSPKFGNDCNGVAILRVQGKILWGDREVSACINGNTLAPFSNTSEPFSNPYPTMLGNPGTLKAWTIPLSKLRNGINVVKLTMSKGDTMTIEFMDIAIK
jgi:hypothetical protein